MGFCTNCGTKLDDAQQFCTSCGARQGDSAPVATAPVATSAAAAPSPAPVAQAQPIQPATTNSGGGALKIVLIIVGVLVLLGVIAGGVVAYIGYRASKAIKVDENGKATSIETPWGKVSTNQDVNKAAEQLGVAVYPGATALEGSGAVSFGDNLSFGNAEFETSDSLDKVEQFYKNQFPKGTFIPVDENQRTMMAGTSKAMVTLSLERSGDKTIIRIVKASAADTGDAGGSE